MTDDKKPLIERRRRKALRPATDKKVCAEFKFLRTRSRGGNFTQIEARVMRWEHLSILTLFVALVYLAAAWLAKY